MYDFVYNNKKLIQIILAIVILPFMLWGVDSYNRSGNVANEIATVEGAKITQQEFNNALRQQQDRLRQVMGEKFDAAMLDTPEMQRAVMDKLVEQRLMLVRAKATGLGVTDEQVAQVIGGIEAFQGNGAFDKVRYATVLANQNMSPPMFEARLRDDLIVQQIQDAYMQNGFASRGVVEKIIHLYEQQRVVSVLTISFQPFMAQAKIDDADIKNYYEQNQNEFQVPDQARVEYVKLSSNDLQSRIEVSDEDAQKYYTEHQSDFGTPEERQAAHILIAVSSSATKAQQDAAKAKADQLLEQARQNTERFAELAKQNSQDPGSAANGGDLGFFGRGMMVKPFEEAAFALKAGEISGLVKSDFGYHIIRLLGVRPPQVLPFEEMRKDVTTELRRQKAAEHFAELAEKFSNAVYEQSDTLKHAADLAGVNIEQSGWLTKGKAEGGLWTEQMLQAVFGEDVVKNKRNTAAIEVMADTLVAARILEFKAASLLEFSEAQERIRKKLLRQQALDMAAKQGMKILAELQGGSKPTLSWEPARSITRAQQGALDVGVARQIFQADAGKLPQYIGAEVAQFGYLVVRIDEVKDVAGINDAKRARYMQQLRQLTGEEMFQAYLADARQQADVKVNMPEKAASAP